VRLALACAALLAATGCLRQAEDRAEQDLEPRTAEAGDVVWSATGGLANFRLADAGELRLWAQAPDVELIAVAGSAATPTWTITAENVTSDAQLTVVDGDATVTQRPRPRPAVGVWQLELAPGDRLAIRIAPPDADDATPFSFAVMGDIQTALDRVDEVFARINEEPGLRFVASTGDLVEDGERPEYVLLVEQLATLDLPYYSTLGNHELFGDPTLWRDYFGRFNVDFWFKGARLSLVDSGNATIDPIVYDWLDQWMDEAGGAPHVFFTHFPPLDPIGVRSGSFRSRKEASKLLARLARGGVDLTLYGHIHSLYEFDNAGIPARISGGGGAWPERFDGIGRHFLVVTIDPAQAATETGGIASIEVVRVDE
jgi:hypothetical protein